MVDQSTGRTARRDAPAFGERVFGFEGRVVALARRVAWRRAEMSGRRVRPAVAWVGVLAMLAAQGHVGASETPGAVDPDASDVVEVDAEAGPVGPVAGDGFESPFGEPDPDMLRVTDREPVDDVDWLVRSTDDLTDGVMIEGFGTGDGNAATSAHISGTLGFPPVAPGAEDDGSVGTGTVVEIDAGAAVSLRGTIGDGPHGETSGDVDVYVVPGLAAGAELTAGISTVGLDQPADAVFGVYDIATGALVADEDMIGENALGGDPSVTTTTASSSPATTTASASAPTHWSPWLRRATGSTSPR